MGEGLGVSIRCRTATAVAAVLLLGAGLTGCEDGSAEPPDSGLPSESELSPSDSLPTSEPTSTEPAGPTAPELPDAATRDTKAGVKAFVAYYLELLTYAKHTGDSGPLLRHSTANCRDCKNNAHLWERFYSRGGWVKGGAFKLVRVLAMSPARPEDVYIGVKISVAGATYRESRNGEVKKAKATQADLDYYLNRVGDHWLMARGELA